MSNPPPYTIDHVGWVLASFLIRIYFARLSHLIGLRMALAFQARTLRRQCSILSLYMVMLIIAIIIAYHGNGYIASIHDVWPYIKSLGYFILQYALYIKLI